MLDMFVNPSLHAFTLFHITKIIFRRDHANKSVCIVPAWDENSVIAYQDDATHYTNTPHGTPQT